MSEAKPNTEEILRRLSEVLDVLKRISEDLQDISKSLKTAIPQSTPTIAPTTAAAAAAALPSTSTTPTPQPTGKGIDDIRMMFTKDLEAMLIFEDKKDFIKITPRQYLGSENFAKIASTVREAGGEYVSAGKDSHFRIPK